MPAKLPQPKSKPLSNAQLNKLVQMQAGKIQQLEDKIRELEAKIAGKNPTKRLDQAYSQKADDARKEKAGGKPPAPKKNKEPSRRGRITTAEKAKLAHRTEQVFPESIDRDLCSFSHTRVAWRLEDGKAVLIAYEIHRFQNQFGKVQGVLGRSEFGVEIVIALAYQVYCLGLSMDKACAVLCFFQQIKLSKSQADRLLHQLARSWEDEFESLCTLLANSAVVYCDETSWSINSVWAFLTEQITVVFYGVHKDGATLQAVIDKTIFDGVLVSDDAAVYQGFTNSQKCWAHLIRKAIKLTLTSPESTVYREFADRLVAIYREGKRLVADKRFNPEGRRRRVSELDDAIFELCGARWVDDNTDVEGDANDYRLLCNEVMRLMLDSELFVFVYSEGVAGNNNASERELRDDAMARKTGRTSKTPVGAKRRSIITSVLRSIGKQLEAFTLEGVIGEVNKWIIRGRSCFQQQAAKLDRTNAKGILDRLVINADPSI